MLSEIKPRGKSSQNLIFRVDASPQLGTGHLMRCLALAQAWKETSGHAIFAMALEVPSLIKRLNSEGMEIVHLSVKPGTVDDAVQTVSLAKGMGADWIVVDGYHFDAEYQKVIKDLKRRILFIDDYGHAKHYYADIVLNQNLHAHKGLYRSKEPYTTLLLGTRYVLLRREFLKWRGWRRNIPNIARRVLVTFGGSDPENLTLKAIQALEQMRFDGLEVTVVVGGSNPHYQELQSAVQNLPFAVVLKRSVANMSDLMAWADVSIASAGTTSLELAFMGLPSLIVIIAENQRPLAEKLEETGIALNLGWYENLAPVRITQALLKLLNDLEARAEMSRRSYCIVDGKGVERVISQMKEIDKCNREII
jgi:UDP-2,4-diacetamido-2,4,6-trideoxy-beta-L-altropyranose hydrolase